jgi:hypothetical protein
MSGEDRIRTVLFQEGDKWVAQCLDVDIAAQARTEIDLVYELRRILVSHIRASEQLGVAPFANLPPAPRRYWDMFFRAESQTTTMESSVSSTADVSNVIPKVEMRAA